MVTLHHNTPTVTVLDNRGQTVREIAYHRHPDSPHITETRITRHQSDARGRIVRSSDPRLYAAGRANFISQYDLNGNLLRSDGADNGTTTTLNDAAGRPLITVSNIRVADDGTADTRQAVTRTWQYEPASLPGRLLGVTELVAGDVARITERFVYAGNTDAARALNLAGACISHYDTAGLVQTDSVALTGAPLSVTRRLLQDADNPDTVVDWQGEDVSAWNNRLATESFTTMTATDATGATLTTTDAKGNMQRVAYDVAGLLSGSWLTLKGGTEQVVVKSLAYSAAGQKLREEHGNGVVTTYTYEPETQRLTGIKTERPAGHTSGAKVLQDQRYEYDAVGNILSVHNDAEVTRFWRNQKVVPEQTYRYDSLYQLVSATGREMANIGQQSSNLPALSSFDNATYTNYTRFYTYDSAGNLTQIRHSTPATNNSYTTNITVSSRSNRGVLSSLTENPAEVDVLFTAGGQQTQLQPGQSLSWTSRNELQQVKPVVREGNAVDRESYRYAADSQRILKAGIQKTGSSEQGQRTVYLPGLELRTLSNGDTPIEQLQVVIAGEASNAQVRLLVWEKGRPDGIDNGVMRYSYGNLTGNSQLELDATGNIISQEEYYPYGGTAIWAARSQTEAGYKTIRYSGKERDATGLYYYGYRYYQPWAGRWLSADPAGTVDGLNLFRMVRNNPVTLVDDDGLSPTAPKLGNYELEVTTVNSIKFAIGSHKYRPSNFDEEKSKYVRSDEFSLVFADDNDPDGYLFDDRELQNHLKDYTEKFSKIDSLNLDDEQIKTNINIGVSVSRYLLSSAQTSAYSSPEGGDISFEGKFFALVKKKDKARYLGRKIFAIGEAHVLTDSKEKTRSVAIKTLVAHPYTQLNEAIKSELNDFDKEYNVKGIGTYATLKAVNKLTGGIKGASKYKTRVLTQAVNVRSAAIAIKYGAKHVS